MKGETTGAAATGGWPRLSPLGALVRRHDPARYQTALFAPADRREALFALYAFNWEIARVRESVSEPMLGQIRLQWWREALAAAYAGELPRRHEVAVPLAAVIADHGLSRVHFDRLIDARERDLAVWQPDDLAALEAFAEDTSATLVYLALQVLGACDAASMAAGREIGIAYALIGLLRMVPSHAAAGRCYIPREIAERSGLDPGDLAARRATPALRAAVDAIAATAASRLDAARRRQADVPRRALPALLPAIVAGRGLARLRAAGCNPFADRLMTPDPLQIWRLLRAILQHKV